MSTQATSPNFEDLPLSPAILEAVNEAGYQTPSPIQQQVIPEILKGVDVLGQAQTGTGKTAAFALPLLNSVDLETRAPQILVLAPTRELAIQVSEAFKKYGKNLPKLSVLPVYGGQNYREQLRELKRGVHVVVGTPGRIMDHMRKSSLRLHALQSLVLDEADEMLKMGFAEDVEWILEQTPGKHQIALFSATMPREIRRIARKHQNEPVEIHIKEKTSTAKSISQRYWPISGVHKLDALTRILEAEDVDGSIIFVRTKTASAELAEKLLARGFRAAAINGDAHG